MRRHTLQDLAQTAAAAAINARGWPRMPSDDSVLVGKSRGSNFDIEVWYRPASPLGRTRWLVIWDSHRRLGERRTRSSERHAFHTIDQAFPLNRRIQRIVPHDFAGLTAEEATALILFAALNTA